LQFALIGMHTSKSSTALMHPFIWANYFLEVLSAVT
jgi:hypothetical protein